MTREEFQQMLYEQLKKGGGKISLKNKKTGEVVTFEAGVEEPAQKEDK